MLKSAVIDFMCLPGDDARAQKRLQDGLDGLDIKREQIISTNLVPAEDRMGVMGKWFMMVILYEG